MKRAGIKVWVLTGDKVGTAKMIGLSTGLLEPAMIQHEIREAGNKDLELQLSNILKECQNNNHLNENNTSIEEKIT